MFDAIFTARKRSLRRLCFYRCLSVHRGEGGWVSQDALQAPPPQDGEPPPGWRTTPPMENPPQMENPPWMENPPRMENPPDGEPPPPGQCAGGTHPTGMHSCHFMVLARTISSCIKLFTSNRDLFSSTITSSNS